MKFFIKGSNLVGLSLRPLNFGISQNLQVNWSTMQSWLPLHCMPPSVPFVVQRFVWLVGAALFCLMEAATLVHVSFTQTSKVPNPSVGIAAKPETKTLNAEPETAETAYPRTLFYLLRPSCVPETPNPSRKRIRWRSTASTAARRDGQPRSSWRATRPPRPTVDDRNPALP